MKRIYDYVNRCAVSHYTASDLKALKGLESKLNVSIPDNEHTA